MAGLVVGGGALIIILALYVERGRIGAELTRSYLRQKGVAAVIVFDRVSASGVGGRASLGPPGDPDLTVERFEVDFTGGPLLKGWLLAPSVNKIRLQGPRLKARLMGGRLTFGSLQPLVDEALSRPSAGPAPSITIEQGDLRLSTTAGNLHLVGDATLEHGRLARLSSRLSPTTLRGGDIRADIDGGRLDVRAEGAALAVNLGLTASRLSGAGSTFKAVQADLQGSLPYPSPALAGPLRLSLSAKAGAFDAGAADVAAPRLSLAFTGSVTGPLDRTALAGTGALSVSADAWRATGDASGGRLALTGPLSSLTFALAPEGVRARGAADLFGEVGPARIAGAESASAKLAVRVHALDGLFKSGRSNVTATAQITAATTRLAAGATALRDVAADLSAPRAGLTWSAQGWRLTAPVRVRARAGALTQPVAAGAFTQRAIDLQVNGDTEVGSGAPRLTLTASLRSAGGGVSPAAARRLALAVPIVATDPAGLAALERVFQSVRIEAPAIALTVGGGRSTLHLPRPFELIGPGDARASLNTPRSGALTLKAGGGGLPQLGVEVPSYTVGQDRGGLTFAADTRLTLGFSGSTMTGLTADLPGRSVRKDGVLTLSAPGCGTVSIATFGEGPKPLVTDLKAATCADAGRPVFSLGPRDWRLHARLADLQFKAPDSEVAIREGQVLLDLFGDARSGEPAGGADILASRIVDIAAIRRMEPLSATGRADLVRGVWSGPIHLSDAAKARPVAEVRFSHAMETRLGHADISAPKLTFARNGLQPRDLSPVGADMISDVEGSVAFTGRADWGTGDLTSSGRLTAAGVNFRSVLGAVKQAHADIAFTSLAPLLSSPNQPVGAQEIAAAVPLTLPSAKVTIKLDRTTITDAQASVAKGRFTLDALDAPFDRNAPLAGVVRLEDIDLASLIDQFNLADKMSIQAKIGGALPFSFINGALRLTNGRVFALGPGRLTIHREALTGASASAPGAPEPPNGMQTFAYQALEDLAFDKLEAQVGSQPKGRLGVLFQINGRHDPPKGGDTRIGLIDLLRGRAFDKPIDLPKGTPVNLTLDTSLNLDELLAAYAGRDRSDSVQPPSGKP